MDNIKLSFGVCTHNEGHYVRTLLESLWSVVEASKSDGYTDMEIVVLDDFSTDPETVGILQEFSLRCNIIQHAQGGDFVGQKNVMGSHCRGEWILQLDADETMDEDFLYNMPSILDANPMVEAFWFPRVNTVDGLTLDHVRKWGWVVDTLPEFVATKLISTDSGEYALLKAYGYIESEVDGWVTYKQPIVCWPDKQFRLYRNIDTIKWTGNPHGQPTGFVHYSGFPIDPMYAIRHPKDIKRQEEQNAIYEKI